MVFKTQRKSVNNIYKTTYHSTLYVYKYFMCIIETERPQIQYVCGESTQNWDRHVCAAYLTRPPFCAVRSSQIIQSMGSDITPHPAPKLHNHPIRRLSLGPNEAADRGTRNAWHWWALRPLNNVCCVWCRGLFTRPHRRIQVWLKCHLQKETLMLNLTTTKVVSVNLF